MLSQDIANLKAQFLRVYNDYGTVSYSDERALNIICTLDGFQRQAEHLEASCPTPQARRESETHGNVVNLRRFRQTKSGDAA